MNMDQFVVGGIVEVVYYGMMMMAVCENLHGNYLSMRSHSAADDDNQPWSQTVAP